MGACASRPKNLDLDNQPEPAPAPAPAPSESPAVPETIPQEKEDEVENMKEEPLKDISEPAIPEAPKVEEEVTKTEPKVAVEEVVPAEAPKPTEATDEGVELTKEEKKEVVETVEKPTAKTEAAAPKS